MKQKIAIIGFGRFGKLLAGLLEKHGNIYIVGKSGKKAGKYDIIKYKDLNGMDWVIPAVPISAMEAVLKKIKPFLKEDVLVMDVCSVKVKPVEWMKKILPQNVEILGTHPMFGPDSAKYGLKRLSMVFCPVRIRYSRLKSIMSIFRNMNLDIVVINPSTHDKEAAQSLSLVHFIGRALGEMKLKPQQVSTMGFERLLAVNETVENDTWELFLDMHIYNPYAKKQRERLIGVMRKLNRRLEP